MAKIQAAKRKNESSKPLIFKDCLSLEKSKEITKNEQSSKEIIGKKDVYPFLELKGKILEERIKRNGGKDNRKNEYNLENVLGLNAQKESQEYMGEPVLLGIKYESRQEQLSASYYIGATWLIPDELSAIVEPRIENLNLAEMFNVALSVSSTKEADYFAKCYGIDFDSDPIEVTSSQVSLTPLLVLHFLSLLQKLVKTGLKKGYVTIDENMKSKIKGKLLISQHLRKNILAKRADRNFCRYQEYSADIPENRLLKKALLFAQRYAQQNKSLGVKARNDINKLLAVFENVSDEISISQIQKIAKNKLFKLYPETCKVAKMILQNYDYSISNITDEASPHKVQPYWIDMARLFELYVYSKLNEAYPGQIIFQAEGSGKTKADYIKKRTENQDDGIVIDGIVIDAKYKPKYNNSDSIALDDVREVCGYARDEKILNEMGYDLKKEVPPTVNCLIIFPKNLEENKEQENCPEDSAKCTENSDDIGISRFLENQKETKLQKVEGYYKFYKTAIELPPI